MLSRETLDLFFCYAQEDASLRSELERHLALLKREGAIRTWHAQEVVAGGVEKSEIAARLTSADVVLLLISADFIATDACFSEEMAQALARHARGEVTVIPILLRPVDWRSAVFAQLRALPKNETPITSWSDRDAAWEDVVVGLREALVARRRPEPRYPDARTRDLSKALEKAYLRRAELEAEGLATADVLTEIVSLKRELREGAQLKAGDDLLDGRYQLLESLGQGGFARVWKAYDTRRKVLVAVKVLHGQYCEDRTRRERFFRGARQMARLDHPGIVRVLEEECEDGEYPFFVMEYVGGGDLRRAVLGGEVDRSDGVRIVLEVSEALSFAHDRGVIHRDVKPANILLDARGRPKLTDFDLVRAADTTGGTRTGMMGTVVYAAPELMKTAWEAGASADVFGLGMTTIFVLHGADLPLEVLRDASPVVEALGLPEDGRSALLRAVEWSVDGRWASVEEFARALRRSLEPKVPRRTWAVRSPVSASVEPREKERVHPQDGSVLVFVPGGEYVLGAEDPDNDSRPVHRVWLSPFWLGKFPVTRSQYARFLEARPDFDRPDMWEEERFSAPDQPVVGVSWLDALAYCRWAGLELPSEAQWEAAARGTDQRPYPWGDAPPTAELAALGGDWETGNPAPVGTHAGVGPCGAFDQAGNVWEWCRDVYESSAYQDRDGETDPVILGDENAEDAWRVLRGGSWLDPSWILRASFRDRNRAGYRFRFVGFRVGCRFRGASVEEHARASSRGLEPKVPRRTRAAPSPSSSSSVEPRAKERIHPQDGSVLVFVPGGEYVLGAKDRGDDARPVHRVRLSPFWLGKFPVTRSQYARFLEARPDFDRPFMWDEERFSAPDQPVVGVSWLDALAYCRWADLELPSEAQWEAAARGTDQRPYPWGDAPPTAELAAFGGDWETGKPAPVGTHAGVGPFGAFDQAGNVWEWCRDFYESSAYQDRDGKTDPVILGDENDSGALRVLRGGSWANLSRDLRASIRSWNRARSRFGHFGFRVCCRFRPEHEL